MSYDVTVDEENQRFIIVIPFAPSDVPYYSVVDAATILGRASSTVYGAIMKQQYGLKGVSVDGHTYVTHDSLVGYLKRRDMDLAEIVRRKAAAVQSIRPHRIHPSQRPKPPKPVTATLKAEELLAGGELDFLDELLNPIDTDTDIV